MRKKIKHFFTMAGLAVVILVCLTALAFVIAADIGHFIHNVKEFFNFF